jgi:protein TonB
LPQLSPSSATRLFERLRAGAGRRPLALGLALLIEGLLLLVLLSFGAQKQPDKTEERLTIFDVAEKAREPNRAEPKRRAEKQPVPQPEEPPPPQPKEPEAAPVASEIIAPPPVQPLPPVNPMRSAPPAKPMYGPPDIGRSSSSSRDSEVVGTAPDGQPLYAASWVREPTDDEMRGYLSTARGPGWGLIACRTVPDYRVEDCVALDEYPAGSQINRAALAAAWQFKVRPPRLGGRLLVGSWVRIRIDYGIKRR